MLTIIETPEFIRWAGPVWHDTEREEFINWIADNPLAGDVIPGAGGLRKVRWTRSGMGKRGGARVIYYTRPARGGIGPGVGLCESKIGQFETGVFVETEGAF